MQNEKTRRIDHPIVVLYMLTFARASLAYRPGQNGVHGRRWMIGPMVADASGVVFHHNDTNDRGREKEIGRDGESKRKQERRRGSVREREFLLMELPAQKHR